MFDQIEFKQRELTGHKLILASSFRQMLAVALITVVTFVVSPIKSYAQALDSCGPANQACKSGTLGKACKLQNGTGIGACANNLSDGEGGTLACGCGPGLPASKPKPGGGGAIALLTFVALLAVMGLMRTWRGRRFVSL